MGVPVVSLDLGLGLDRTATVLGADPEADRGDADGLAVAAVDPDVDRSLAAGAELDVVAGGLHGHAVDGLLAEHPHLVVGDVHVAVIVVVVVVGMIMIVIGMIMIRMVVVVILAGSGVAAAGQDREGAEGEHRRQQVGKKQVASI